MADSMDPVVRAMLETLAAGKVLIQSLNDSVVVTRHHSCYGQGLATAPHVPSQHLWVTSGDMTLNGHAYIGAIKINLVSTALRSARGCPNHDIRCDCCGRPESLGHILQVCPRTHALGIARHDKVVDLVRKRSSTVFAVNRQYQLQQVFEGWT